MSVSVKVNLPIISGTMLTVLPLKDFTALLKEPLATMLEQVEKVEPVDLAVDNVPLPIL